MEYTTIGSYAATGDALLEELRNEVSRFWPWNRIGIGMQVVTILLSSTSANEQVLLSLSG